MSSRSPCCLGRPGGAGSHGAAAPAGDAERPHAAGEDEGCAQPHEERCRSRMLRRGMRGPGEDSIGSPVEGRRGLPRRGVESFGGVRGRPLAGPRGRRRCPGRAGWQRDPRSRWSPNGRRRTENDGRRGSVTAHARERVLVCPAAPRTAHTDVEPAVARGHGADPCAAIHGIAGTDGERRQRQVRDAARAAQHRHHAAEIRHRARVEDAAATCCADCRAGLGGQIDAPMGVRPEGEGGRVVERAHQLARHGTKPAGHHGRRSGKQHGGQRGRQHGGRPRSETSGGWMHRRDRMCTRTCSPLPVHESTHIRHEVVAKRASAVRGRTGRGSRAAGGPRRRSRMKGRRTAEAAADERAEQRRLRGRTSGLGAQRRRAHLSRSRPPRTARSPARR